MSTLAIYVRDGAAYLWPRCTNVRQAKRELRWTNARGEKRTMALAFIHTWHTTEETNMPSIPGEPFQPGYHHPGDRVLFEGQEYRVTSCSTRTNLAYLASEGDHDGPGHPVHVHNLTLAWCPKSHGGTGRPVPGGN